MKNEKTNTSLEVVEMQNLQIGDVVTLIPTRNLAGCQLTVINVTEKEVTFFRPYVSLSDFTYSSGAIPFIGVEKFSAPISPGLEYVLLENIYRGS